MNPFRAILNSFTGRSRDLSVPEPEDQSSEVASPLPESTQRFRTIWISDTHLGTRNCHADFLLDFLRSTESDYLYLVGDIIDGWQLTKSWYWPQTHNDVVQKILRKARKGTQVVLIPGNHDEFLRKFGKHDFGRVTLSPQHVHTLVDGRKLLILHGDQFDSVIQFAPWLAHLGDEAYEFMLSVNRLFNQLRARLGMPYWSISAYLKNRVKNAVNFISAFENVVILAAKRHHVDGIVCGHIHKAEMREIEGVLYCNDGDWVESCTALVEHPDGRLELLNWIDLMKKRDSAPVAELEPVGVGA
jgi:UDP-2,3-diacylglucosamine pyrophosphatase LpxH